MNPVEPDLDRLRRAWASWSDGAVPTEACPEPDRLWAAVRGELAPEATRGLVEHTLTCGACAESWRLAREVGGPLPLPEALNPALGRPRWGRFGTLLAAAAAAVVVATMVARPRPSPYREIGAVVVRSRLPEGRPLSRSQCVLRWSPGPTGSRYDVRVATEDLTMVAAVRGLEVTEYRVPEGALARLPSGAKLLWQVEALSPDGTRLSSMTFVTPIE